MIEYHCRNCGKKFKPREYMKLETISSDIDNINTTRKCDVCGNEIKNDDKTVKA